MNETTERKLEWAAKKLAAGGFLAPQAEAEQLLTAAAEANGSIDKLLARRLRGEPLAWITGSVYFCGLTVRVAPGLCVPRPHTEELARRAVDLLPSRGVALDLCTGSGAVALVLQTNRPQATVIGTDIDPVAVECAHDNGVETLLGDLDEPVPTELEGRVDVMTAIVPYVPTEELYLLPRDVLSYEPRSAIDGGTRGTDLLLRVVRAAPRWLGSDGRVLLELGGDQANEVASALDDVGLTAIEVRSDGEGQDRMIEAHRPVVPGR